MYSKKEKKNILRFLIKLFTFTLLIWMLQCSNNWNFFKSLSFKNDLKNTLNLGVKRFLAQKDIIKEKNEEPKFCDLEITETNLESRNDKKKIGKKTYTEQEDEKGIKQGNEKDIEQGNEIEAKDKNKKVKFNEEISGKCKNNLKLVLSFFAIFMSIFSFIYNIIQTNVHISLPYLDAVFISISLIIISITVIQKQIEAKFKNNFKYF
ncbi:Plasmodium exported protein, unknown function [Plasmodium relictum]|uniref:Fam-h protein n=1 Tax=Plasmodium relictum TaxID=85471 RepID=A0A1J1GK15_PLARL|nr:Plasmodium exported protein, unknown function [Plasmodium relictum]CRG84532.1 Plasmodium exported protein, unknown function [Plasmodium relictum]